MIGVDTNILMRYLMQDEPAQARATTQFMRQLTPDNPGFLSIPTLLETHWLLRRGYRRSREEVKNVIRTLLTSEEIVVQEAESIHRALKATQGKLDFPDALIAECGHRHACSYTVTFDAAAARLPHMRLLDTM